MSSLPFDVGQRVTVTRIRGQFTVVSFDGSTYRLRSDANTELRVGRKQVAAATKPDRPDLKETTI